jgi:hypothetical protein
MPRVKRRTVWGRFPRKTAFALLLSTLAIGSIVYAGWYSSARVQHHDRFRIPLTSIDYTLPSWVDANTFLAEIRYLGDLPEQFHTQDPVAVEQIRSAFAKHPWVESVAEVGQLTIDRRYALPVTFREPRLIVRVNDPTNTAWMVDSNAVLLPSIHVVPGLAELRANVPPPTSPVGKIWNDDVVRKAANLARLYPAKILEKTETGWRITEKSGRTLLLGS